MNFGIATLLPAFIVILIAVLAKRTNEALIGGCVLSYLIIAIGTKQNPIPLLVDSFFSVVTDYDTMWLVVVCGLFGSLIAVLNAAHGTHAISNFIGKLCKTQKSTLLVSWLLGILIFVDDYMNILTICACTKRLSDERKIPREALAYVVDSTGAPVCVLLPFSTWAIFFAGVFYEESGIVDLGFGSAMSTYIHAIPYMFYAIAAVLIVPLFILGVVPKLGAMKKAYERVEKTGAVYSAQSEKFNKEEVDPVDPKQTHLIDFLGPILTLILVQLTTDDMFIALIASVIVAAVLYLPRRKVKLNDFFDLLTQGFADLVPALFIIISALWMKQASSDLNLPSYVIGIVKPLVGSKVYPMIAFIVVALLGFITGSNWGIPAVCAPVIIPLGAAVDANLLMVMAAIVCGGTFCSHACFYSDATVITSTTCGVDNMDHAATQLPYAMLAFAVSCIAFLIAGFVA